MSILRRLLLAWFACSGAGRYPWGSEHRLSSFPPRVLSQLLDFTAVALGISIAVHSCMKPQPRWRVLIVDDHAPSRTALAEAITGQGGQVVGNGSRAEDVVHLVERYRPDVAVFAVGLTDGDGVEAARQVMASYPCALVVLTSRTEPEVAARAAEAGVLGFLAKPLRAEELGPALDLAVSRFRDLQAVRRENQELKRKLEARKLVDRAKALLIQRLGLSEAEAYRRLQKTAMDTRKTMGDVAQALLLSAEMSHLRPIKH